MGTSLLLETTTTTTTMLHVACHFAGDALCSRPIINQHKSGRESKRECFVVSLLHFQGSVQDHLEGIKRPDISSA